MDKDRIFWGAVRRALLLFVKAIEVRYLDRIETTPTAPEVLYSKH